jgi:hypothetical protein
MLMTFLIGALFVAVLVRMLLIVVPFGTETMRRWRLPAQMLLLGVPALVVQTDLLAILVLASSATAVYELLLIIA